MSRQSKQIIGLVVVLGIIVSFLVVMRLKKSGEDEKLTEQFFAMDTVMDITLYKTDKTDEKLSDIMTEMRDRIYQMEAELSVTKKDSDVSKLNAAKGAAVKVSEDTYYLLSSAIKVADETEGRFDPTIYPIVKLWGFTTGENKVPSDDEIKKELSKVDYTQIHEQFGKEEEHYVAMHEDMQIDLGACAKGYLSDVLCQIMWVHNVDGIVSLGGNVKSVGTKPDGTDYTIGIADPKNPSSVYEKIVARNNAVVTSGNYERYFEQDGKRYHHIMDPKTGVPADNGLASVTVVGPNGLLCDAYATAFFVMGEDKAKEVLKNKPDYHAAFIYEDGHDSGFDELK